MTTASSVNTQFDALKLTDTITSQLLTTWSIVRTSVTPTCERHFQLIIRRTKILQRENGFSLKGLRLRPQETPLTASNQILERLTQTSSIRHCKSLLIRNLLRLLTCPLHRTKNGKLAQRYRRLAVIQPQSILHTLNKIWIMSTILRSETDLTTTPRLL